MAAMFEVTFRGRGVPLWKYQATVTVLAEDAGKAIRKAAKKMEAVPADSKRWVSDVTLLGMETP